MQFLKNVLSTIVGLFVFCLIFVFVIIIIAVAVGSSKEDVVEVKKNSVIELDISKVTDDYAGKFYSDTFGFLNSEPHDGLSDVLNAIDVAKTDDDIKGISITNSATLLGMAQNKALRDKLEEFKKSGKFVVAYSDNYSQTDYYLNSVADTIYANPVGEVDFKGLSSELMFFKDFEEKTGIKMEVIRHGKFKSAVEPFISNEMSPENREQMTELLNSVWNTMAGQISESRHIPLDSLNGIATHLSARTPDMAKTVGLIDKVAYEDQYRNGIKKALKVDYDDDYNSVDILDYAKAKGGTGLISGAKDKIAIVYAQGDITSGEGFVNSIGEISIRKALKEAREDDNIKAVVFRVNSPGGNALTSDLIWREIEITKKVKPVVVSMGTYAASGGYYISCNANRIFAEPNTITGSIGVFGILPNFSKLSNNLGIHTQQVNTHENSGDYSLFMPLEDKERGYIQESVERTYHTFLSRVAEGRHMTTAAVDSIGQGRVWSGTDALKIGLVDELGGMDKAIAYAAKLGKTTKYTTENFPEYEMTLDKYLSGMSGLPFTQTREELIKDEVGEENYRVIERLRRVSQLKGAQLMLPYEITIH